MYKLASLTLCSNVAGQVAVGMMVNPPKQGDASYELYEEEKNGILNSLQRRVVVIIIVTTATSTITQTIWRLLHHHQNQMIRSIMKI